MSSPRPAPPDNHVNDTISRSIEALMTYHRISRADICRAAHLSNSSYYNRINGAHGWSAAEVSDIARLLGVNVQTLYDGLDGPDFRTGSFLTLGHEAGLPQTYGGNNPTVNTTTGKPWTPHAATSTTSNCVVLPFRPSKRDGGCTAASKPTAAHQ